MTLINLQWCLVGMIIGYGICFGMILLHRSMMKDLARALSRAFKEEFVKEGKEDERNM